MPGRQQQAGDAGATGLRRCPLPGHHSLTRAEQTAREHRTKAARTDEIEAANKTDAEKAVERATAAQAQLVNAVGKDQAELIRQLRCSGYLR